MLVQIASQETNWASNLWMSLHCEANDFQFRM